MRRPAHVCLRGEPRRSVRDDDTRLPPRAARSVRTASLRFLLVGATLLAPTVVPGIFPAPAAAQPAPEPRQGDLVLLGGRLFDALPGSETTRPNPGVLVRNGTILSVAIDDVSAARSSGARVVELEATHTLLPGFVDVHAHYAVDLFGEGRIDEYEVNPLLFLANGVTSTFPAGEIDPVGMREARQAIARGERPGPRIFNSGPYFGTARPGWEADRMTPDSIAAEVDFWAELGARGFKAKGIRPGQLAALVDAAHRHGLPVTAHLGSGRGSTVNPRDAILLGIDRIEHFLGGDALPADRPAYESLEALDLDDPETERRIREVARLYVRHGTFFDATLTAYGYWTDHRALDPAVYEKWTDEQRFLTPYAREVAREGIAARPDYEQFGRIYRVKMRTLRAFLEEGGAGLITLGTDHPSWGEFIAGFSVHREMHGMSRAGIPNADVLRIATHNGARALGMGGRLGTVAPGTYADLVVVDGDPVADITATRRVVRVVKAGRVHDPAELLEAAEGAMGPAGPEEADLWKGDLRAWPWPR